MIGSRRQRMMASRQMDWRPAAPHDAALDGLHDDLPAGRW
jgi:hypothetical protein